MARKASVSSGAVHCHVSHRRVRQLSSESTNGTLRPIKAAAGGRLQEFAMKPA